MPDLLMPTQSGLAGRLPRQVVRRAVHRAAMRWSRYRQWLGRHWSPDSLTDDELARRLGAESAGDRDRLAAQLFCSADAVLPARWTAPRLPASDSRPIRASVADILEHRFDLLGSGLMRVDYSLEPVGVEGFRYEMAPGRAAAEEQRRRMEALLPGSAVGYEPIDWHRDFKSGYRWSPDTWFSRIRYGGVPGADVKVPWELSRFQHAGCLGLVHRLDPSGPEGRRAAGEFRSQVIDWIAANPPRFGVNWACAMEVAIRAVNWLIGLALFDGAAELTPDLRWLLGRNLYAHALHIEANLEYSRDQAGNHYLANVVGLTCIGAALPEAPEGDRWLLFGLQEVVREMERQVLPDGVHIEGSSAYHHLAAEMLYVATAVALRLRPARRERLKRQRGQRLRHPTAPRLQRREELPVDLDRPEVFPGWYLDRLLRMAEFAADLVKADGRIPQFGDNDSGRLYHLWRPVDPGGFHGRPEKDPCDRRSLLSVAGRLFHQGGLLQAGEPFAVDGDTLVGAGTGEAAAALERFRHAEANSAPIRSYHAGTTGGAASKLVVYEAGGLAVARCGRLYLAITCLRVPPLSTGGHFHNDILGFELQWDGIDFIVDGGSYLYTPSVELRNAFRSTTAHSTIAFVGHEQRSWPSDVDDLFRVAADAQVTALAATPQSFAAACTYGGIEHTRSWMWGRDWVGIEDQVSTGGGQLILTLAPEIRVVLMQETGSAAHEVVLEARGRHARILLRGVRPPRLVEGLYSAGYGRRIASSRIQAELLAERVTTRFEF